MPRIKPQPYYVICIQQFLIRGLFPFTHLQFISDSFFSLFSKHQKKKTDTAYQNHIARLEARSLRAQMNPHFIYNALNSLQSVMLLKGERETNRYIGMLSKLLRFTLEMSTKESITLREEIDYFEAYLGLQKMRLDSKMNYKIEMEEKFKMTAQDYLTSKTTVDTYTEIENLDKLYDRSKSWKVETANVNYPSLSTLPISANGSTLNLGDRNLIIDATAASVFAIDKNTNTITIKANTLKTGTKFTSITTTGTISTANSATIEFGFIDSGGTQKYLELTGLASADVSVEDNVPATPVSLGSATNQTGTYKLLFSALTDASNTVVEVTRTGYTSWTEQFPENDLCMTPAITQYQTTQLAERQIDMLNYAHKILQKEEAINANLNATTPKVTVTNTITSTSSPASEANQLAILNVLKRILSKITSNREALNR